MRLIFPALFLVAVVICSVLDASVAQDSDTPVTVTPLVPRRCPSCPFAYRSGIKDKARLLIRDNDAWQRVWMTITEGRFRRPPLPEIDFSREMVVVAGAGEKRTGGYGIVVDRVYEHDGHLNIVVTSRSPGRNCAVTEALTQPVDIVRLPKLEIPPTFRETETTKDCKP